MVGYPSQDGYYLVWNVESAVLGHEGGVEDEVQHVGAVHRTRKNESRKGTGNESKNSGRGHNGT